MPYIRTDNSGNVISLHRDPSGDAAEPVAAGDPRVAEFLGREVVGPNGEFLSLDLDLIRVLEDLVDVLIERNVITFTDLPAAAQEKSSAAAASASDTPTAVSWSIASGCSRRFTAVSAGHQPVIDGGIRKSALPRARRDLTNPRTFRGFVRSASGSPRFCEALMTVEIPSSRGWL